MFEELAMLKQSINVSRIIPLTLKRECSERWLFILLRCSYSGARSEPFCERPMKRSESRSVILCSPF